VIIVLVAIAEKVFKEVKGQGHCETKCICAAESYNSTVRRRGSPVFNFYQTRIAQTHLREVGNYTTATCTVRAH